jgi:anti-sigma regulatory factor (Ser/Thr protein kinase)
VLHTDRVTLPPRPASVSNARHFVAAGLASVPCPDAIVDDALLLVSELATNAVRHAGTAFTVGFSYEDNTVTVEVADRSRRQPSLRRPDVDRGRGPHIVAALAAEWGVRDEPEGKAMFFRLPC